MPINPSNPEEKSSPPRRRSAPRPPGLPDNVTPLDSAMEAALAPIEAALAPGDRPPFGRYRLDLATGRWQWEDEVYVMHGFEPGEVVPTTQLMLSHKHPEDRPRVDGMLRHAATTGEPFSSVHRIYDADGGTRTLAVVGQGVRDPESGLVTALVGWFVDMTRSQKEAAQREATASIRASAERRAAIEQAKGVLMVVFRCTAEEAFERLRRASNAANIPVRDLALWLMGRYCGTDAPFPSQSETATFLAAPTPPDVRSDVAGLPGVAAATSLPDVVRSVG